MVLFRIVFESIVWVLALTVGIAVWLLKRA
jgi:hypothetical protein